MASSFATAMMKQKKTWNDAPSLHTPDKNGVCSGRLSLFFHSVRGLNAPRLFQLLKQSSVENILDTFLIVFHIRDCRAGKGERNIGRLAFKWLFINYPKHFMNIFEFIPEYGRWDDLLELWPNVLDLNKDLTYINNNWVSNISQNQLEQLRLLQNNIVSFYGNQLKVDQKNMLQGGSVSLCAKWAPTERGSLDFKHKIVKLLCSNMKITIKDYRKQYLSPLREYLNIVEKLMCSQNWSCIDYNKVPSCAMKRLKNSFEKHSPVAFREWANKLQKREAKVNAKQLFPHELVQTVLRGHYDIVVEKQWEVLQNETMKLGVLKDCIPVVDTSGSMSMAVNSVKPIDVSLALGIMIARSIQGDFHNNIITFSSKPSFFQLPKNTTLLDTVTKLSQAPWGYNTDLQSVFNLILSKARDVNLPQQNMPKYIFIISDMQFDNTTTGQTNFQEIEMKYKKYGYDRPNVIFWNVNGSITDFPVSTDSNGTCLISGYSTSIMKALLSGDKISSYDILRKTIDDKRYTIIKDKLF